MTIIRSTIVNTGWAMALMILLLGNDALAGTRKPVRVEEHKEAVAEKVVNLNTATSEQLQLLPGIGKTKAQAILAYRGRSKFSSTFQLTRVKGIGRKTFLKLRPYLSVQGETTLTEKVKLSKAQAARE